MKKASEKQKKIMSKKKKVVAAMLFVFAALIVGTLVHSLFLKDTTESKTIDKTEVVENDIYKNVPKDDSTPDDYSLEENISICQNVIKNMNAWSSKTEGTAVADVLFMNYTQNISARKVIKNGNATQQSASESSLLSTGQQRTFKDGAILIRNAKKVKSIENIEWEDDFTAVSKDTYSQNYGRTPFALTNYVIDKTTIIKSRRLDTDKDKYKFEYELKPDESTVYYKRQMRTEGGASDYPTFHSVKVTVTMDKQWRPLVIHYSENYDISIAVVGDVTCQGEITETFSDFGEVKTLPDEGSVDDFIKNKYDKNKLSDLPTKKDTDISKYVKDMFTNKPYYHLNLSVDKTKLNLDMLVDINNGIIKIKGKKLFAAYAGKKLYLQYGDVRVSMKTASVFEAIRIIGNAIDIKTESIDLDYLAQIDLNNISLDDKTVSGLLNNVKMEQSKEAIKVAFEKDGIKADVKVALKDENVNLEYADISLKLADSDVTAKITNTSKTDFPKLNGFHDISKVTTLLQPWIDTLQAKGIGAKVSMRTSDLKISGKAVLGYQPMKLKFLTKIEGINLNASVVGKFVYISAENIRVKCKLKDIESTVRRVMVMVGIDMKKNQLIPKQYAKTIKQLKDGNINIKKLLNDVKSVSFKDGYLSVKASINKLAFKVAVSKNAIKINQGKSFTAKAKITKKYKKNPKVKVKKSRYVSTNVILKSLSKLSLYKLLKSKGIILDTRISGNGFELKGIAKASYDKGFQIKYTTNIEGIPITLIYKNDVIYAKSGNIKIKGSSKYTYQLLKDILKKTGIPLMSKTLFEAESFGDAFERLIKEYAGSFTIKDIIGNVKTFQYKKGYLIVQYKYAKGQLATIKLKKKTLSLSTAVLGMNFNAKLAVKKIYTKSPLISVNSSEYTKLSDIINVLEQLGLEDIITSTGIDTDVILDIDGITIKANVKADYRDKTVLLISTNITDGKTTIPVIIKYIDGRIFVDVANIHVKATLSNLGQVLSQVLKEQNVSQIFATDISRVLKQIIEKLSAKDMIQNIQSFSCDGKTLKVLYHLKDSNLDIAVTGRTVTVKGIKISGKQLDVSAKINNTKNQNIIAENPEQYVDIGVAYQLIQNNISNIQNSKALGLQADLKFDGYHIVADIIYDKSVNGCKIVIPYNDEIIELTYVDDIIYIHFGKFYLKSTRETLLNLIKKYTGYEPEQIFAGKDIIDQISLAMLFDIKNVTFKDGRLMIEYQKDNVKLNAVLESYRDEISVDGIEIGDTAVNGKIVLENFFDKQVIDKTEYQDDRYLDFNKVLEIIDVQKIEQLIKAKGIKAGVQAKINDYEITGQLAAAFGESPACRLNTQIEGIDITATVKQDNLYINASGIHLIYDKLSEAMSGIIKNDDLSQITDNIKNIQIVDDKIVITIVSNNQEIEIILDKNQITVRTEINDTKLDVILNIEEIYHQEPPIEVKNTDYSKVTDVLEVLKQFGVEDLLNATGIEAEIQFEINQSKLSGKMIYFNDNLYLQTGNIYIKTELPYIICMLKDNGINIDTEVSAKDILDKISQFRCDGKELSFVYNGDTPLRITVAGKKISVNDMIQGEIIDTKLTEIADAEKYVDLKTVIDFVKKWRNQPAVTFNTVIDGRQLSVVYENKTVYVEIDGLKVMSDDSSVASIINAVLRIYGIDITPALQWLNIVEDEKDIHLEMFKQYADMDGMNNIISGKGINIVKVLENINIGSQDISYKGQLGGSEFNVKLYDSTTISMQPDGSGYIDVSSMDTLLKAFGETAGNMNFDMSAKASLALSLGLFDINLKDVPLSAKLKVEKEGVYGNVHADVPYMKSITDSNVLVPGTTTETTESTSKTKTEVKTSYSLKSDSQKITTDFYITPTHIYLHKNIQYELEKTVTTTKYKKVLLWIPQSTTKNTETVKENKDFYMKRTYKEMQNNIMSDLCFALNMSDSIRDKILDSSNSGAIEDVSLGNIIRSYSFDNVSRFDFGLNLSGLTDGAITNTDINLYRNSHGYLNNLHAECKLYSLIAIKLDADLNNIGQAVDIGFKPEQLGSDKNYK